MRDPFKERKPDMARVFDIHLLSPCLSPPFMIQDGSGYGL